jgi:hypothetical protein
MAKKNKKKYDDMAFRSDGLGSSGSRTHSNAVSSLLKRYDVDGARSVKPDMRGQNGYENRSVKDVKRDLSKAMMNDYDTRRTMEAAAMAGDKDAKKFAKKGIKAGKVGAAWDTMKDLKKKYVGGGGMDGAKNRAGLTYAAVKADRDAQTAAYDDTYAKTTDLNSLKDKLMKQATNEAATPIEPSDRMAAVEDRFEKAAGGSNTPPSLFDKDNAQPAKADDQKDAARNFVEDYKLDVMKGANIKSDIETGVSNAARHVRDTYGR